MKKLLTVGIICLLMLVSIPMVSGKAILYPKEEGPYNVFISGKNTGMGGGIYTLFLHFWPLWFLPYILSISWHFQAGSVFIVNGEEQDIEYPAQIDMSGFKGYDQSDLMFGLKHYMSVIIFFLTGFQPTPRARIIGQCTEIIVNDAS